MNTTEILALKLDNSDFHEDMTIGCYFRELLTTLWIEGESFSGKRPFGNSGWEYDVYTPLIKAGAIDGVIDEYGDVDELDRKKADRFIVQLIEDVFDNMIRGQD